MHWKSWPYWVRGAGIGGLLFAVSLLVLIFMLKYAHVSDSYQFRYAVSVVSFIPSRIALPLVPIFCKPNPSELFSCLGEGIAIVASVTLFEYICFGAVTGYFYGKVKNRRQLST